MNKPNHPKTNKRTERFLRELHDFNPYAAAAFVVALITLSILLWL